MNVISSYIESSWLRITGAVMLVDVLICLAGLAFDHTVITGASAWLKPLNFGISVGIFCFTVAFFLDRLPKITLPAAVAAKVMAAALTAEILLIDMQAARHTTSHFNVSTGFDSLVWLSMGIGILLVVVGTVVLTISAFRARFEDAAMGWVMRLGLLIALAGMSTGFLMTLPTPQQLAQARAAKQMPIVGAHTVGAPDGGPGLPVTNWSADHGDLRVAHFVGFHGMQLLLLVWWLAPERRKLRLIFTAAASYAAAFLLVLWQALRGQPVLHPDALTVEVWVAWLVVTSAFVLAPASGMQVKQA